MSNNKGKYNNNNKNHGNGNQSKQPPAPAGPRPLQPAAVVAQPARTNATSAVSSATEAGLAALVAAGADLATGHTPAAPDLASWPELWNDFFQAKSSFDAALAATQKKEADLATRESALQEREVKFAGEKTNIEQSQRESQAVIDKQKRENNDLLDAAKRMQAEAKKVEAAAVTQLESLSKRESDVAQREAEAAGGFAKWRAEQSQKLSAEVEKLRQQSIQLVDQMADERAKWPEEELRLRSTLQQEIAGLRAQALADVERQTAELLAARHAECARLEDELRIRRAEVRASERLIADREQDLQATIKVSEAAVRRSVALELQAEQRQRQALEAAIEDMRGECFAVEEWKRTLGDEPVAVRRRQVDLEAEVKRLRDQLADRPAAGTDQRLQQAEAEVDTLQRELTAIRAENARLGARHSAIVQGAVTLDTARREAEAYRVSRDVLAQRLEALRGEVDSARQANAAKSPFEACAQIASDCTMLPKIDDEPVNLTQLANEVRSRLATEEKLYFAPRVVRTFLAGMASSRLILLEGISGTGKSSLPISFAKVMGIGSDKIEVQAGWRDRHDLFGHYNTFERRYQETKFLKALVRAGTPTYRTLPMLILMDEMNLSHPEQYFADILSALEGGTKDPEIELIAKELDGSPELLSGGKVRIQDNTWFIGTANQDETTKDFADKTYDRAHLMWLPRHHDQVDVVGERPKPRSGALSFEALQFAFDQAPKAHSGHAEKLIQELDKHLSKLLERTFEVGWGNRLEKQIRNFVPAYVAAGGQVGEAADHIIASKLVRKVRGKHDVTADDVLKLRDAVQAMLKVMDSKWLEAMSGKKADHDVTSLAMLDREGSYKEVGGQWKAWWAK
jgi:hypothetical protein